jgi:hypothetical protein
MKDDMEMKQGLGNMKQAMTVVEKASEGYDGEVQIAADDAGATAAMKKLGKVLEYDQSEFATGELSDSDQRTQQATSPIGSAPKDAASSEVDRELTRQAGENAKQTDELMRRSGFGSDIGTE